MFMSAIFQWEEVERDRGNASARGYDHAYAKFRESLRHDLDFALCRDCLEFDGRLKATEEYHHIVK